MELEYQVAREERGRNVLFLPEAGVILDGTVTLQGGTEAVPHAMVFIWNVLRLQGTETYTDEAGYYRAPISAGSQEIYVLPDPSTPALYALCSSPNGQMLEKLTDIDVVFPVLHGTFGEDGTMQGLLEMANAAYVGAGVLGSSVGLDKALFKDVMRNNGIPSVESMLALRSAIEKDMDGVIRQAESMSPYPLFTKPANLGSSVGVTTGKAVIGLPGNPVSALVNGYLFVVPVLEKLLGVLPRPKAAILARLTINLASQAGREDWWPVKLIESRSSKTVHYDADPIFGMSNLIFTLAAADGLLRIPPDATGLSAGEEVEVVLI